MTDGRIGIGMHERRVAPAAGWAGRFALFAATLFLVAGAGHRFGLVDTPSFLWLLAIIGAVALIALVLAGWGFWRLWTYGDRAGRASLLAAVVAALVLAPYGLSLWRFATLPLVNDVSTDMADPPTLVGRPPYGPEEARAVAAAYPEVNGRRYPATPDRVADAVLALAAARGWTVGSAAPMAPAGETVLTGRAHTPLLGFPIDVAFRISDEGETSFVDMRSAGLYGRHDMGDNAARIVRFLEDLDAAMAAEAGLGP